MAEADAAQLKARLDASAVESDDTTSALRQDAARLEAAQSELAAQLAAAASAREVILVAHWLSGLRARCQGTDCRRSHQLSKHGDPMNPPARTPHAVTEHRTLIFGDPTSCFWST